MAGEFGWIEHRVFGLADLANDLARGQFPLVDIVGLENAPDHRTAVVLVVDREIGIESKSFGFVAQQPHANGVEGSDPYIGGWTADQCFDAFAHFAGGLVGEGYGEYPPGCDTDFVD